MHIVGFEETRAASLRSERDARNIMLLDIVVSDADIWTLSFSRKRPAAE